MKIKEARDKEPQDKQIQGLQGYLNALLLHNLLTQGKILVLMDGLDEIPTRKLRRNVQSQLRQMAEKYPNNRWILTCRTQIIESIPDRFTSVEVADFSSEQVQQFVQNWFKASGQLDTEAEPQWEKFAHAVGKNQALKELTVTPVLLSLMCLVFHDEGEMPSQMTDLYKRGIRLLLEKWNDAKAIEDWEVGSETYRQLSVEQKEALLIEIAAHKFENPENFVLFQENELATQIAQFLQRASPGEGIAVLKAMEAQHGLLIERADELWSFSHLTFQEHFTIQWLTQLPSEQLAEKIANQQWQQVVEQLVNSQQPVDRLLRLIKQSINRSIAGEPTLNQFLTWVFQKAGSIEANYKPAALRAFYSALAHTLAPYHVRTLTRTLAPNLADTFDLDLACTLSLDLHLDHTLDLARERAHALDLNLNLALDRALTLARTRDSELVVKLEKLRVMLPSQRNWQQWWHSQGQQWLEQLRQVMVEHRNMGHDWQFNEQQKQQLQRYYDANKFLVKMVQIEGAVSEDVRAEIEDSLLLPWEELQRRYPEIYGNS